jgi:hypothetical protein
MWKNYLWFFTLTLGPGMVQFKVCLDRWGIIFHSSMKSSLCFNLNTGCEGIQCPLQWAFFLGCEAITYLIPIPRLKSFDISNVLRETLCRCSENGRRKSFQNVWNIPIHMFSYPWTLVFSPSLLWQPQISQVTSFLPCVHAFILRQRDHFCVSFCHYRRIFNVWQYQRASLCSSENGYSQLLWNTEHICISCVVYSHLDMGQINTWWPVIFMSDWRLYQRCTNPSHKCAMASKFCVVVPNVYGYWVWNLLDVIYKFEVAHRFFFNLCILALYGFGSLRVLKSQTLG